MLREGRAEEGETGKKPEMPPGRETGRRCPRALSGTGRMRTANLPESIAAKGRNKGQRKTETSVNVACQIAEKHVEDRKILWPFC